MGRGCQMANITSSAPRLNRGTEMTPAEIPAESVRRLVTLRLIAATAGERVVPSWWRTQFLTEAGLRSMRRIFPRTALGSALACVTEAARAEHDSRIGIGGVFIFSVSLLESSNN
jgi:hypothetical protein